MKNSYDFFNEGSIKKEIDSLIKEKGSEVPDSVVEALKEYVLDFAKVER